MVAIQKVKMETTPKKAWVTALLCIVVLLVVLMKDSTEETSSILDLASSTTKHDAATPKTASNASQRPPGEPDSKSELMSHSKSVEKQGMVDLSKFKGCSISDIESMDPEAPFQPFWIPSYPNTDNGIVSKLIENLTGIKSASKSYYASVKGLLKHCFAKSSVTVSCEQLHPVIGVKPETKTDKFQRQVFVALRSPVTVIPAHHQHKAVLYHHVKGQVGVESWRGMRDEWLPNMLESWQSVVGSWKNMTYYSVSLYLPYEQLLDPNKGVEIVRDLSQKIKAGGYPVAKDEDLPCVWYSSVRHILESDANIFYPYAVDYIPGFSQTQIGMIEKALKKMQHLYADDVSLNQILTQYLTDLKQHPRIDT